MLHTTVRCVAVLSTVLFTVPSGGSPPECVAGADAPQGACAAAAGSTAGISLIATGQPALGIVKTFLDEAAGFADEADLEASLLAVDEAEGPAAEPEPAAPPRPAAPEPPREAEAAKAEAPPRKPEQYYTAVSVYLALFVAIAGGHHLWQATSALKAPVADEACGEQSCPEVRKGNVRSKDEQDDFGCTALHVAADRGSEPDVRALLGARADVHARDAWDETPLHFAARAGSAEACGLLLDHGAEVNPANEQGYTPLLVAAKAAKEPACRLLLERGGHAGGAADDELPPLLSALLVERVFDESKGAPPPAAAALE